MSGRPVEESNRYFQSSVSSDALDLTSYDLIEGPVFIKDKAGRYLWANAFFINHSAGAYSLGGIVNKQDSDFPWHEYADELRFNDYLVIEANQSQSHYEQIVRYDGTYVNILTRKSPLTERDGALLGLIGFSIALPAGLIESGLSKREKECVSLLSKGCTLKKIAKQLTISARTVETHLQTAKSKMGVETRSELIAQFCRAYPLLSS